MEDVIVWKTYFGLLAEVFWASFFLYWSYQPTEIATVLS